MVYNYEKFVKRFVMVNAIIVCLVVISTYFIANIFKENYSDSEILENYENVLYGSSIKDGGLIKLRIIGERMPDVIALGSSRVMQFRADYFQNKNFYTLGGLGSSIEELEYTWGKVRQVYVPKVVIVGIDPWWLNPNLKQGNNLINGENEGYNNILVEFFRNKNMRKQLLHMDEIKDNDALGGRINIGLDAAVNGNGYRLSDGSRQYGKTIQDKEDNVTRFKSTYERMEKGAKGDRFVWCDTVSDKQLEKLQILLCDIKKSGAEVVVFLPPFPHEVYDYMDNNPHYHNYLHEYIYKTNKICDELEIPWYNFCDLASVGSSDDEAIDGFHGSDLAYARITALMGKDRPLSCYINRKNLQNVISNPIDNMQAIPASN